MFSPDELNEVDDMMAQDKLAFDNGVTEVRAGRLTPEAAASALLSRMTDDELLWLLDGDVPKMKVFGLPKNIKAGPITAGVVSRLGIPGVRFSDGPRGVVIGRSTSFPVTMARAASWDPALEQQVGLAMGLEARAQGANYSGAVCVNLLRHPAWGRAQECYGEDPVLTGQMGAALALGLRPNVMACVKHFALNSMENARFSVDVKVDEHALHEVYLPHFRVAIMDGKAASVMSAYNSVNGSWADMNRPLLTDILRDEWGFQGFVTSDWVFGTHDALVSLEAGMDVEMPARLLRKRKLPGLLRRGKLPRDLMLRSGRRILSTQIRHAAGRDPAEPRVDVIASSAHRALAHQCAVAGTVLLKNEQVEGVPILPLTAGDLQRVAVIGRLADAANLGDRGSSLVDPPSTSSPLEGLRAILGVNKIVHDDGADAAAAARAAADADVAIVVVGMTAEDEGESLVNDNIEGTAVLGFPFSAKPVQWLFRKLTKRTLGQFAAGGDRQTLTLRPDDEALVTAIASANQRTLVVVIGGSAILMEAWRHHVPAIMMAWYPGMEGGRAIADMLTGAEEPGGRLPVAIPTAAAHLPFFDPDARTITYDAWWGQRMLDRDGNTAAFPFGHGLGYTRFETTLVHVDLVGDIAIAVVRAVNVGARRGGTVVQIYAFDAAAASPVAQLVGFGRIAARPGEAIEVKVPLDLTPTQERSPQTREWSTRPGDWRYMAAQASPTRRMMEDVAAKPGAARSGEIEE